MNKIIKKKSFLFLIIILIMGIAYYFLVKNLFNDLSKNSYLGNNFEIEEIFKSKRAFGNDYFDIYKIKAKDKNASLKNSKKIDYEYYEKIKNFKDMISVEEIDAKDKENLLKELGFLENSDKTSYVFKEKDGRKTMYIYNYNKNIGYILDFQI